MNELQKPPNNLRNGEIRKCTLGWSSWWFLMLPRAKTKNRCVLRFRKVNGVINQAQCCFNWKKSQNAIDELMMNSPRIWSFLLQFTKTDVAYGLWITNQKESSNFMKKWWRNLEKCWWSFWENLENGGKVCYDSWELQLWLTFCYD